MKKALIVLDVQKIYTDEDSDFYCEGSEITVNNINKLIQKTTEKGDSIYLIKHIHKEDGSDLGRLFDFTGEAEEDFDFKEGTLEVEYDQNLIIPENKKEIIKNRYSAFTKTNLENILKENEIQRVIICGFMTNFCCESTARDALDRDFYVDFVIDATGTPGTENYDQDKIREFVSELLAEGFARVMTTEELLALLEEE